MTIGTSTRTQVLSPTATSVMTRSERLEQGEELCHRMVFNRELIETCRDHLPPTFYQTSCVYDYEQSNWNVDSVLLVYLALVDRCQFIAVCPNFCSFHGDCVQGRCQCDKGWTGTDCSVAVQSPTKTDDGSSSGIVGIIAGIAGGAGGLLGLIALAALIAFLVRRYMRTAEAAADAIELQMDDITLPADDFAVSAMPEAGPSAIEGGFFGPSMNMNPLHKDNDLNDEEVFGL